MSRQGTFGSFKRSAFQRLRRTIETDLRGAPWYRELALTGPAPSALAASLHDLRPGSPARGRELLDGHFVWAGESVNAAKPDALWRATAPSNAWRNWAHGFDWLRHVIAADAIAGPERARNLVDAWIAHESPKSAEMGKPELAADRILAWLAAAHVLFPSDDALAQNRLESLARQTNALNAALTRTKSGRARLRACTALTAAGLSLPDEARLFENSLKACGKELEAQIAPDGGHVCRTPDATAQTLADLLALETALAALDVETPPSVRRAIDRLAPMLRFFMLTDGGLPAFHGGGEGDRGMLEAAQTMTDNGGRPFGFAPHTGYHRVESGGALLLFDSGAPHTGPDADAAHASPLAFEFAPRGGRLIVNCGWDSNQPERFRDPVRATAAHSALVVEDTSSMRLGEITARRDAPKAPTVHARRTEEELGVWIEGGHEGYLAAFGLSHRRRIFMDSAGGDLRGEDTLFRPLEADTTKSPRSARFSIRFHLHPEVSVSRSRDGRSALLTLPDGEGWRFRSDAGALTVEPSIYLAAGGGPLETRQLVLAGITNPDAAIDRPPNRTRWALQRLGRAPAA